MYITFYFVRLLFLSFRPLLYVLCFLVGQMRSLRVFYSNPDNTQGQIVIASRESQYKILHFHHGGLDKLAEIFQDWSLFAHAHEKTVSLMGWDFKLNCINSRTFYSYYTKVSFYVL